jgi:hypothetical protein
MVTRQEVRGLLVVSGQTVGLTGQATQALMEQSSDLLRQKGARAEPDRDE